jgi:hypothetical protein
MTKAKDQAPAKAKFLEVKQNGNTLIFEFGDKGRLTLDTDRCSEDMRTRAMFHGFNQKVRDSAAGYSKEQDFAGAREEMGEVIQSLYDNTWNRQGGGAGAGVNMEDLAKAIAEMKKTSETRAMAAVSKATEEQRKAWSKNAQVAALIAKYKAERLAAAAEKGTKDEDLDFGLDEGEE